MTVIDISRYQGVVDFGAVKSAGVGVVIAKMGGGDAGPYVDANWSTNRDGIRAAGLKLGSYYFNGPGQSPIAAADYQFQNIGYQPGDLVVIDVEGGAIAWSVSQVIEWVNQMLTHGVPASSIGVYMSASVVNNYNWGPVAALGTFLWVASYGANTGQPGTPPSVIHWSGWAFWQYTSNGSVAGVPGRVDVSQIAPGFASSSSTPLDNTLEITDMPKNFNSNGTIFTLGETFGTLWTNPADFSYLTNMAVWGAAVPVSMTPDQVTTAINEANMRGRASQAGTPAPTALTPADVAAIDASLQAEFNATLAAIHSAAPAAPVDLAPVLTELANLTATLTKGYTFNVKPSA